MLLRSKAKDEFNIEPIGSEQMDSWINECVRIYQGNPCWLDPDDNIDTVNMAKSVCSEIARLTMLAAGVKLDGSARAKWLQEQVDKIYFQLREWVEYGCAYGTIVLKPNGDSVDLFTRGQFEVTHISNGKIDGIIFHNWKKQGKNWYTRLEYHRFENDLYLITNKCYIGDQPDDTKESIEIQLTPWANLAEEVAMANIKKPLFGVFRTPNANNIDMGSPYGLPVYSEAIQELRDLDMKKVRFAIEFTAKEPGVDGCDVIRFLMSANAGEDLKPISRIASGGELARIMLALKNVLAEQEAIGTLVFDEVDTGVSGRAAQKVAEKLAQVSRRKQVLCVTHLPQLAAMADTHFSVEKGERGGRTYTQVVQLDREQRKAELARITGGTQVTEALLESAGELLSQAEAYRAALS